MTEIKDLEQLKKQAERLQQQKHRAEGRLQEAQKRLKDEFEVSTLRAGEKLLKQLEGEEETAREDFETALDKFNEEWGDKLDG
jgi:predicted  nucleic acid-binding Zn-ribbon protein